VPRILIVGCGYVGRAAAELFVTRGWDVEAWSRSGEPNDMPFTVRAVDVTDLAQVGSRTEDFDFVLQATSTRGGDVESYRRVYLEGARNLCRVFAKSTLVFTSSTSVYAQQNGDWVTETSETTPENETGRILIEAEQTVLERGAIVLRFGGIYGPGRSAILQKFLQSNGEIDPAQDRNINTVHRDDAAAACVHLLNGLIAHPTSAGQSKGVYNVVDDEPILLSEAFRWLGQTISRDQSGAAPAMFSRRRGRSNKRVSNAKLRATGWAPRYPTFRDGMRNSVLPASGLATR
jgi:nucleoside-diphosphate-sugar epimerase